MQSKSHLLGREIFIASKLHYLYNSAEYKTHHQGRKNSNSQL